MSVSKGNHGKYSPLDDLDDSILRLLEGRIRMDQLRESGLFNPQPWQMPSIEDFDKTPDKFEVTFQMPVMDPESIKKIFLATDVGI